MKTSELANYQSAEGAARYDVRYQTHWHKRLSDRVERRLLRRLLLRAGRQDAVLDVPCGTGRLSPVVAEAAGWLYETDISLAMLELDRSNLGDLAAGRIAGSALALPFRDGAVGGTVSVRLTHHLTEPSEVEALVRELCRVSREWVIVSYFAHSSLKARIRQLRSKLFGKRRKNTVRHAELRALAERHGFRVECAPPLSRLFSGHHFALLRRVR